MHILAYCYHWSRDSLWELPRNERKKWVEIVLEQKRVEAEGVEGGNNGEDSQSTYREGF